MNGGIPRLRLWERIPLRTCFAWPARGRSDSLGWAQRSGFQQLVPEFLQDLLQISSPICHPTTSDVPATTTVSMLPLELCSCGTQLCSGFKHHLLYSSPHSIADSIFKALARHIMHLFCKACIGQTQCWLSQRSIASAYLALIHMHTCRCSFGTSGCLAAVESNA